MENPLVSIIVPVYNVEAFLDECLTSIAYQSYMNLEIILLPGNSVDKSTVICEEWAKKDDRIKIVVQDKNCLGYARNKGVQHATGEYIAFCDSDDKLVPTYVEDLLNSATSNNSDIVECEYYAASEDLSTMDTYDVLLLTRNINHDFYERFGSPSACKYLVKKEYWIKNGIKFPESSRMEDLSVYTLVFNSTSRKSFVYKPLYIYRQNQKSIMHTLPDITLIIDNFLFITDFVISEHRRLKLLDKTRSTLISQLEHHGEYQLEPYKDLSADKHYMYQCLISVELKKRFDFTFSVFDIRALGWGSSSTGILCNLLTKRADLEGNYIHKMTLRAMTNSSIREQFEEITKSYVPSIFIIDLLEELDYISNYEHPLEQYINQWTAGVCLLKESLEQLCPSAHIFIVERKLARYYLTEDSLQEFNLMEDIDILNDLLDMMYKSLTQILDKAHFIESIPDSSRYSLSSNPKDGNNFDEAYYYEKIVDILHQL